MSHDSERHEAIINTLQLNLTTSTGAVIVSSHWILFKQAADCHSRSYSPTLSVTDCWVLNLNEFKYNQAHIYLTWETVWHNCHKSFAKYRIACYLLYPTIFDMQWIHPHVHNNDGWQHKWCYVHFFDEIEILILGDSLSIFPSLDKMWNFNSP